MGCGSSKDSTPSEQSAPSKKPSSVPMGLEQSAVKSAPSPPTRKFFDFYNLGEPLGQGSFSVVKTARSIETGQKVAVKIVNRQKLHPKDIEAFLQEVEVLRTLDHPNI
eukprot:gene42435-51840_t